MISGMTAAAHEEVTGSGRDGAAVVLRGKRGWVCRLPECGARRGR